MEKKPQLQIKFYRPFSCELSIEQFVDTITMNMLIFDPYPENMHKLQCFRRYVLERYDLKKKQRISWIYFIFDDWDKNIWSGKKGFTLTPKSKEVASCP